MAALDYSRLADLYDTYVRVNFDIPFFLQEARQTAGEVLELMAGTGRVSLPLIKEGIRLTCIDASGEMLTVLREKLKVQGLSAVVHQMDICNLELNKRFDLIILPFHSFSELKSTPDQREALRRVRQHLADRGTFICTLHNPVLRLQRADDQYRLLGSYPLNDAPGRLLFWGVEHYDPTTVQVSGLQLFEEYDDKGVMRSKRMVELCFTLLAKDAFEGLAAEAGLKVIALYGDYAYAPFDENSSPFMIWKLQKETRSVQAESSSREDSGTIFSATTPSASFSAG